MALWPRISSGEVGSSINQGLNGARYFMYSIASGTDHTLTYGLAYRECLMSVLFQT